MFGVGFHGVDFVNPTTGAWITAHNSYINLLADLGVCGFVLVVSLFVVMAVTIFRNREWYLLADLVGLFLHFVTEAFLYAPLFVMTIGTLYGVTCIYQRTPRRRPGSPQMDVMLIERRWPVGLER
jgi:hypothetical protein